MANKSISNPAPHSQRKATRTSPLHRQIHSCGQRLWSYMWSNAKNGLVPTPIREGTSPSSFPRKRKLSRAFAGKQKKNGNRTIPVFLVWVTRLELAASTTPKLTFGVCLIKCRHFGRFRIGWFYFQIGLNTLFPGVPRLFVVKYVVKTTEDVVKGVLFGVCKKTTVVSQ